MSDLLVLGDSVPLGDRTDATPWPARLPDRLGWLAPDAVTVHGSMGTQLVSLADDVDSVLAGRADVDGGTADDGTVVLVHAGHNDAQTSGGEPRVAESAFRAAASRLDERLESHGAVDRHAFVGLVPLLALDRPGTVPFAECQPERSLSYDDALADAVERHVPVARPVDAWDDRTADGVHPTDAGHAHVAERVAAELD